MTKILKSKADNFSEWYTNLITKGELISYGPIGGTIIFRPDGYAIWQEIQRALDKIFYNYGVTNVYMPSLIPKSLMEKEKKHIDGFAPEFLEVTRAGVEELEESFVIRPTSEVMFGTYFSQVVESHRDLPLMHNQWVNVIRWEKSTRPFLRNCEFLWQEGHTIHSTSDAAEKVTNDFIEIYKKFVKEYLALPVIIGQKSELEKFAGAEKTYTIEALMADGQSLQAATSHYLGQNFSKQFNILFTNKENVKEFAYQTSWGLSTRIIGAIIMAHSDDNGLILPPKVAPRQIVIIPYNYEKNLINWAEELKQILEKKYRVKIDIRDKSFGYRINDAQFKGVPIIIKIGKHELAAKKITCVLRNINDNYQVEVDNLLTAIDQFLVNIHQKMYDDANEFLNENITEVDNFEDYQRLLTTKIGYFLAPFCNRIICEEEIKKITTTVSRCKKDTNNKAICFKCGQKSEGIYYFARAY